MTPLQAMLEMRHGPLDVPVVVFVPSAGIAIEAVTVRASEVVNYIGANGAICRGPAVVIEASRAPAPDQLPDA